jgi:hypothetical protein
MNVDKTKLCGLTFWCLATIYHEANQPKFMCFERAGGFGRNATCRPLQIDPRKENRNHWRRPSGAFGAEGSAGPIAELAEDPIGNSFGHNGCTISACFQISDGEWKEPPGGIGVVAPDHQVEWTTVHD